MTGHSDCVEFQISKFEPEIQINNIERINNFLNDDLNVSSNIIYNLEKLFRSNSTTNSYNWNEYASQWTLYGLIKFNEFIYSIERHFIFFKSAGIESSFIIIYLNHFN